MHHEQAPGVLEDMKEVAVLAFRAAVTVELPTNGTFPFFNLHKFTGYLPASVETAVELSVGLDCLSLLLILHIHIAAQVGLMVTTYLEHGDMPHRLKLRKHIPEEVSKGLVSVHVLVLKATVDVQIVGEVLTQGDMMEHGREQDGVGGRGLHVVPGAPIAESTRPSL